MGGISLDWSAEESNRHGVNKQNSKVRIKKLSQPAGSEDLSAAERLCRAEDEDDQVAAITQAGQVWKVPKGGANFVCHLVCAPF